MRATWLLLAGYARIVAASPIATLPFTKILLRGDEPDFDGPAAWSFTLLSFSGLGCPDYPSYNGTDASMYMKTRPTTSSFYKTANDVYWMFFAFPWMRSELARDDSSRLKNLSCDMVIRYEEVDEYGGRIQQDERTHNLKLHRNGTVIEANYSLDGNVSVEWGVEYSRDGDAGVVTQDSLKIDGPLDSGSDSVMRLDWLTGVSSGEQLIFSECGAATFRVRLDLSLAGRAQNVGGAVDSKIIDWGNGKKLISGVQMGISHDWKKC